MKNLKHKILELLTEGKKDRIFQKEVLSKLKLEDKALIKSTFEELDGAGHGVYTHTLEGISLAITPESKKAFEDGVYLEKEEAAPVKKEAKKKAYDESKMKPYH